MKTSKSNTSSLKVETGEKVTGHAIAVYVGGQEQPVIVRGDYYILDNIFGRLTIKLNDSVVFVANAGCWKYFHVQSRR